MNKEKLLKIGNYCKQHRVDKLGYSLTDFCKVTDNNIKNVSAFENGRANNISYLISYWKMTDVEHRVEFLKGLFECV